MRSRRINSSSLLRAHFDAATKIRTFSQLVDTTKEAIGSGWAETFEILFGDFEEASDLFTAIGDWLGVSH